MKNHIMIFILSLLTASTIFSQSFPFPSRNVHTYSIVAYDRETNQMGVAVQSHYFGVGSIVTWVEPGVVCLIVGGPYFCLGCLYF